MAGDWIKLRKDLPTDPAVIRMAGLLGLDTFSVVGRLAAVWVWADTHADRHGRVTLVSRSCLDGVTCCPGFGDALASVGWLQCHGSEADGITFPHFDRHMGEGAKSRASAAKRKRNQRERDAESPSRSRHGRVTEVRDRTVTREEKRREEKKEEENPPYPPQPGGCSTEASEAGKKTRERKPKADEPGPESVAVPPALDTPTFRAAWSAFLAHRAAMPKAKRLTANAAAIALAKLLPFGPAAAAEKCERSVMNGWTGVVFPGDEPPRATPTTPSATGPPVAPTMQKTGVAARIAALHEARKAAATQAASDPCQTMPTSAPTGSPPGLPTSPSHSGPGPTSQT